MALITSNDCCEEIKKASINRQVDLLDVNYVNVKNILKSQFIGIRKDMLPILIKNAAQK